MKCVFLTEILWEMYTSCVASTYFGVAGFFCWAMGLANALLFLPGQHHQPPNPHELYFYPF